MEKPKPIKAIPNQSVVDIEKKLLITDPLEIPITSKTPPKIGDLEAILLNHQ